MKWLLLLTPLLKPFFNLEQQMPNPVAEIKEFLTQNAMRVLLFLTGLSTLAMIFSSGIIIIALDIGAQLSEQSSLVFSPMMIVGFALAGISLLTLTIVVASINKAVSTDNPKNSQQSQRRADENPIQTAVAHLIEDYVKEREFKRNAFGSANPISGNMQNGYENSFATRAPHH